MSGFLSAPLVLTSEAEHARLQETMAYAYTHGIIMGTKGASSSSSVVVQHAPFALYPFAYPRPAFALSVSLSRRFNRLMQAICRDPAWIQGVLRETVRADPFTARLLDLMNLVEHERSLPTSAPFQHVSLGILRSDYMLHSRAGDPRNLLQVEINTFASSFGCISSRVVDMAKTVEGGDVYAPQDVPDNGAVEGLARGIASAQAEWVRQLGGDGTVAGCGPVVLMVVQPGETNFCDQRLLHFALRERFGVSCIRATLAEIHAHGALHPAPCAHLLFKGRPVSVCYFRAGYQPSDYPSAAEWAARERLERSSAVKCPDIYLHLAGTKKVQQELARPGTLERFLSPAECVHVRQCFAGMYSLDSEEEVAVARALVGSASVAEPQGDGGGADGYVLKPQREGGGNNFFGEECRARLQDSSLEELKAFILMERIQPPAQTAVMVRQGEVMRSRCICELGVYGVFLGDRTAPAPAPAPVAAQEGQEAEEAEEAEADRRVGLVYSANAGYLLRVKPEDVNEGGVAAGFAVLGCPVLV